MELGGGSGPLPGWRQPFRWGQFDRDEIAQLTEPTKDEDEALGTLRPLVAYQSRRGQAVLYLATSGFHWDAEIVLRAYLEATARILFIALAPHDERGARIEEFWKVLGGIGDRRRAVKSESTRDLHSDDPRAAAVFDVFRNPAIFEVEPKAPKAARKSAEQRWSFSEIIKSLSKSPQSEIGGLPELAGYLHPYGWASHLLHVDPSALDLMHDRATRPPQEEALLTASQIARIFTDVVGLSYFCADAIRVMVGAEFKMGTRAAELTVRCIKLAEPILDAFYESQAEFYRSHGRTEFDVPADK